MFLTVNDPYSPPPASSLRLVPLQQWWALKKRATTHLTAFPVPNFQLRKKALVLLSGHALDVPDFP